MCLNAKFRENRKKASLDDENVRNMKKKIEEIQENIEQTTDLIVRLQEEQNKIREEVSQMGMLMKEKKTEAESIKKEHEELLKSHNMLLLSYEREKSKLKGLKKEADDTQRFIMNELDSLKNQKEAVSEERKRLAKESENLKSTKEELINLILMGKKAKVLNQDRRMNFDTPLQLNQDMSSVSLRKFKDVLKTVKAEFEFASI